MKIIFKRSIVYILCGISLIFGYYCYSAPVLFNFSSKIEVYVGDNSSTCKITEVTRSSVPFVRGITGEACVVENYTLSELLEELDGEIVHVERTGGTLSLYGYTKKFRYEKQAFSKTVNFHVVVSNGKIMLGTPIIYGSF